MKLRLDVGLVRGRHDMPVEGYIFDEIENPLDFDALDKRVSEWISSHIDIGSYYGSGINQVDYADVEVLCGDKHLYVYVTGLTSATAAVIGCCARNGIALTLMHFDKDTGTYLPQRIF